MTPDLIQALTALTVQIQAWFLGGALVFVRIGPMFSLLPIYGERSVPARVKIIAALATTLVVTPAVVGDIPVPGEGPIGWFLFLAPESMIGVMLGMALRLIFMVLMIGGTMAAQATSLSQAFGGAGAEPQPAISHVLVMAGLCMAAMAGMPERLVQYIVLSYDLFSPGQWPLPSAVAEWGIAQVSRAFALGFSLAAPFVIGAGLYNLALGAINRAMPQLMVAFVGAPALTLGGMLLFLVAAPIMLSVWLPAFLEVLSDPTTQSVMP
ncbi:flagellar biosynthetic protein FliR [Pararhodobacter sp. CCB-MM2]|uniref:flagellar biosynthetic protein FliR n=1 Tax=Pararhodobacter sp. CCB-MM2 TaxID=1786003 RepID=UPI0009F62E8F|nr:flagellar biosynthetic protein FliR [Pararhodobacter sp. CCB-MM2]